LEIRVLAQFKIIKGSQGERGRHTKRAKKDFCSSVESRRTVIQDLSKVKRDIHLEISSKGGKCRYCSKEEETNNYKIEGSIF
jgi:hypothetical protein